MGSQNQVDSVIGRPVSKGFGYQGTGATRGVRSDSETERWCVLDMSALGCGFDRWGFRSVLEWLWIPKKGKGWGCGARTNEPASELGWIKSGSGPDSWFGGLMPISFPIDLINSNLVEVWFGLVWYHFLLNAESNMLVGRSIWIYPPP